MRVEQILHEVQKATGVVNLEKMSWEFIADNVILPKMAGDWENRKSIGDSYMKLLANNAYTIFFLNKELANVLFEIALQRLDRGAVLTNYSSWPDPLPKKYYDYSSLWNDNTAMTEGCFNFIMLASETCLRHGNNNTRSHMLKILLGLIKHISPDGSVDSKYHGLDNFKYKAQILFVHAKRLVESNGTFSELYPSYALPDQWEKHKDWFSYHYYEINWDRFFKDTKCLSGNFIQRLIQKRRIKKDLKTRTLPVAL